jgi:uncharacterized membrane protein
MDTIKWIIIGNAFFGLLQILIGLPLLNRKVPRNYFYGIRTRAALASDQRWYDINAYAGRQLVIWSVIMFLNGLAGFFIPRDASDAYLALTLALAAVAVVVPLLLTFSWSRAH